MSVLGLVPLDDRPVCLAQAARLAGRADLGLVTPPPGLLGHRQAPGDPEALLAWLGEHLGAVDAWVLSLDMLVYGGLLASREPREAEATCRARLDSLARLLEGRGARPCFGFSVIRRFASTVLVRADLAEWEARHQEPDLAGRVRNHQVNRKALELVAAGHLEFLSLLQEDCQPTEALDSEHGALRERIAALGVAERTGITPGADEGARVLLARAVATLAGRTPTVALHLSSTPGSARVARYENVPLAASARGQLRAAGAREVAPGAAADLELFVWCPDREPRDQWLDPEDTSPGGGGHPFFREIRRAVDRGKRVVVADVADANGASRDYYAGLLAEDLAAVSGYAAWNTAGNSLGCALSQGLLPGPGGDVLVERYLEDVAYQMVVRPLARRWVAEELGADEWDLDPHARARTEDFLGHRLRLFWRDSPFAALTELPPHELARLPWGRLFDLEVVLA